VAASAAQYGQALAAPRALSARARPCWSRGRAHGNGSCPPICCPRISKTNVSLNCICQQQSSKRVGARTSTHSNGGVPLYRSGFLVVCVLSHRRNLQWHRVGDVWQVRANIWQIIATPFHCLVRHPRALPGMALEVLCQLRLLDETHAEQQQAKKTGRFVMAITTRGPMRC
jgi:hypothetical protein